MKIYTITLLLLYGIIGHASTTTINFTGNKYPNSQIRSKDGMGRNYLLMGHGLKGVSFKLSQPVIKDFGLNAWIRIDRYPNNGKSGFSTTNPATIISLDGKTQNDGCAILRLNGKKLEFSVRFKQGWIGISGGTLPKGKWILVSGIVSDGKIQIYGNNELLREKKLAWQSPLALSSGTIGYSAKRIFVGGIDEAIISVPAPDCFILRKMLNARGEKYSKPLFADWKPEKSALPYKYLRVTPKTIHPLAEGSSISATIVPWIKSGSKDLLVGDNVGFFGHRITIHPRLGTDAAGVPVYGDGLSVALAGTRFWRIPRKDGTFDLLANGHGTPFKGDNLIYYRNIGKAGAPKFASPMSIKISGKKFKDAVPGTMESWAYEDVDGDDVKDLLITSSKNSYNSYFPDGQNFWNRKPCKNSGSDRGYDITGNWLGDKATYLLFWARGKQNSKNIPEFGEIKKIYVGNMDYQVQWRFYAPNMIPGLYRQQKKSYILLVGDIDRILALPYHIDQGTVRCGKAVPVMKKNAPICGVYWPLQLKNEDMDGDGISELLLSGNPGRAVVLKGSGIGEFRETGSVLMRGGPIELDTLVTPFRGKWDNDQYPDLVCGDASGYITFWRGTPNPLAYGKVSYLNADGKPIHIQAGMTGSLQGPNERRWGYTQPTLEDWDCDGKNDIISGDILGNITLYRQNGSPLNTTAAKFTFNGKKLPAAWRVRPAVLPRKHHYLGSDSPCLLYLDADGDLAMAVPEKVGSTQISKSHKLHYNDGKNIHMCGTRGFYGRAKLTITDWDGDGKWDVLWGHHLGAGRNIWSTNKPSGATVAWFRNLGTNSKPVFSIVKDIRLKNGDRLNFHAHNASVQATDLNNDGKDDLIVGAEDGKVYYFFRNEFQN